MVSFIAAPSPLSAALEGEVFSRLALSVVPARLEFASGRERLRLTLLRALEARDRLLLSESWFLSVFSLTVAVIFAL